MTILPYIFTFIIQLIILLIIVNLSRRFLILISKNNFNQKKFLFYYDVSIYLVWILFIVLKLAHALNDNLIVVGSAVLILIILMWEYLKNLFLGIIFAFQYGYIREFNLIIDNMEGRLENYFSSYIEILTNKGEKLKIKYQNIYSGTFEVYKENLYRVFKEIKIQNSELFNDFQIKIMNHPLFLLNSNYNFYQKRDENGTLLLGMFFNVMNYKDALIVEEYIDQLNNPDNNKK